MTYVADGPVPWPVPPDWANGVRETLAFKTDVLQAKTGHKQKRRLRRAPRRSFAFDVINEGRERRLLDMLLFDHGAASWELPIWHDVQRLTAAASAAAESIDCRTAGFEFVEGGRAMLWRDINLFEVVTISGFDEFGIFLAAPLAASWPAGTRLYPVRAATLIEPPEERGWNDRAGKRRVTFRVDEPCDWEATYLDNSPQYRDLPVLEWRPDEGDEPTAKFVRDIDVVDDETGPVETIDFPQIGFRTGSQRFLCENRDQHAELRNLAYSLAGSQANVWLPSWNADLQLSAPATSDATVLSVEWCGYALFGRLQEGRDHIRIELKDGSVFYRQITDAEEAGAAETLTIDEALGQAITPASVRLISFLALSEQATDTIELEHVTDADGITRAATNFVGVLAYQLEESGE